MKVKIGVDGPEDRKTIDISCTAQFVTHARNISLQKVPIQ